MTKSDGHRQVVTVKRGPRKTKGVHICVVCGIDDTPQWRCCKAKGCEHLYVCNAHQFCTTVQQEYVFNAEVQATSKTDVGEAEPDYATDAGLAPESRPSADNCPSPLCQVSEVTDLRATVVVQQERIKSLEAEVHTLRSSVATCTDIIKGLEAQLSSSYQLPVNPERGYPADDERHSGHARMRRS
ncbi:hypothetical protein ABBQ38_007085 [Trebouxia sp. C0009 RCD-2024]